MSRLIEPMEIIAALDEAVTMSATIRIIKLALSDAAAVAVEPLTATLATLATEIEGLAIKHERKCAVWNASLVTAEVTIKCECTCGATAHNERVAKLAQTCRAALGAT